MKILHTNMLRGWGGQSNRIFNEAQVTREAGHDVAFAIPHASKLAERARAEGFTVFPGYEFKSPAEIWKFLPDLRRFLKDVRSWRPDLIHLHGSQDTWLAVVAKQVSRDFPPLIRCKHNIFEWKTHGLNRWLYRNIDVYLSVSTFIDRQISEYPGLGEKPRDCLHSIPDLSQIAKAHSIRKELVQEEECFLWISTGRLRNEKAFDVLLPAFAMLHKSHPHGRLLIAGDGSLKHKLHKQAQELGLFESGAVRFLGFRKDVANLLKSADAYVHASRSEGLGTAILEALGAGLPVVAAASGGIPESVKHRETGLLVPIDNPEALAAAMAELMDDTELRQSLAEAGVKFMNEEFSRARFARRLMDFYESALKSCE